jgi:hypothetical protein
LRETVQRAATSANMPNPNVEHPPPDFAGSSGGVILSMLSLAGSKMFIAISLSLQFLFVANSLISELDSI